MRSRLWWLICAGAALGVGAGAGSLLTAEPVYSSAASVLVEPLGGEPNLRTEAQLVRSTKTTADARASLAARASPATLDALPTVEALPGTSVLVIRFEAGDPAAAQAGAQAFAEAYLANRGAAARAALDDQTGALVTLLDKVNEQLEAVNRQLAGLPANSPDQANVRSTLASLTTQAASLSTRLNELRTTPVNPGRIISDADEPARPVRPVRWHYLAAGALSGALLGLAASEAWVRLSRRVRNRADLGRHHDITLLADLASDSVAIGAGPQHPSARAFNRLRNEVIAALCDSDRTLLVTSAAPGAASVLVAANLAAAFARAESDVVLVGASVPELEPEFATGPTTLAQIFDVADIPGLTDVLTGRTSLARALQRAARSPRLRVVTPGGTASATGLLQSEGARGVLRALARQARYVVIEAPSTAAGADAQSLASASDAALLVVEAGRARHAQVADAATQLRRVGTRLLGAVVVPKLQPGDIVPRRRGQRGGNALDHNTDAWIGTTSDALEAPTTRLRPVPHPDGRALSDTALSDTALSDTALSEPALSDTELSEPAHGGVAGHARAGPAANGRKGPTAAPIHDPAEPDSSLSGEPGSSPSVELDSSSSVEPDSSASAEGADKVTPDGEHM